MSYFQRLLALAALGTSVFASSAVAQDAKIVKIVGQGIATVVHQGASSRATENMALSQNDDITTQAGVEVYIQAYPGAIATVKPNTHVVVANLGTNTAELDLKSGNIVSQLDPAKRTSHNYGIRTPKGVAAARGTVYTVNVQGTNYTIVTGAGAFCWRLSDITFAVLRGSLGVPEVLRQRRPAARRTSGDPDECSRAGACPARSGRRWPRTRRSA